MIKNIQIIIVTFFTIVSHGQKINFQSNINYKARGLNQSLNLNRDSLLLESKIGQIYQVDIFNENFSESFEVNGNDTKIDLKQLPIGNFVVQARLDKKHIIMYLEKNEELTIASLDQEENVIDHSSLSSFNESRIIAKKGNSAYYYVVSESNSNFGSSKTMRLEHKNNINKIISKHKLELKSKTGRNNKLLIYEVYDKSKFLTKQLRNSEYYKTEVSELFNTKPLYNLSNEKEKELNPQVYASR